MNLQDGPIIYHRAFQGSVEIADISVVKHAALLAVGVNKLNGLWSSEGRLNAALHIYAGGDDPTDSTATIVLVHYPKRSADKEAVQTPGRFLLKLQCTFHANGAATHPFQRNDPFTNAPPVNKGYLPVAEIVEASGADTPGTNYQLLGDGADDSSPIIPIFDVLGGHIAAFVTANSGFETHIGIQGLANG